MSETRRRSTRTKRASVFARHESDEFLFFGDAEFVRRAEGDDVEEDVDVDDDDDDPDVVLHGDDDGKGKDRDEEFDLAAEAVSLFDDEDDEYQGAAASTTTTRRDRRATVAAAAAAAAPQKKTKKKKRRASAPTTAAEEEPEEDDGEEEDTSYEAFRHKMIERNKQMLQMLNVSGADLALPATAGAEDGGIRRGPHSRKPYKKRQKMLPPDVRRSFRIKGLQPDGSTTESDYLAAKLSPLHQFPQPQPQPEVVGESVRVEDALRPPPVRNDHRGSSQPPSNASDILAGIAQIAHATVPPPLPPKSAAVPIAASTRHRSSQAKVAQALAQQERDAVIQKLSSLSVSVEDRDDGEEDEEEKEEEDSDRLTGYPPRRAAWDRVHSLAVLNRSDADIVAAGSTKGDICVWHASADKSITFYAHSGHRSVTGLAWARDGDALFSVGYDGALRRLDVETGISVAVLRSSTAVPDGRKASQRFGLCGLALDVSGHVAYTGALNGCFIAVDDRQPENPTTAALVHGGRVCTVQLHPLEEAIAVTSSFDGCAALWDLRMLLGRVRHQQSLSEMYAATGEHSRRARDIRGCIAAFEHKRSLSSAFISPHEHHSLLTTCSDNFVRVWKSPFSFQRQPADSTTATNAPQQCSTEGTPVADLEWRHETRTGPLVTAFQATWDPHHPGIAAIGCLGHKLRIFGEWPVTHQRIDISRADRQLTAPPSLNVWHPAREYSLVTAMAEFVLFWK